MDDILESEYTGTFPPEYIAPREKEKPWYGLQYARAVYMTSNRMGPRFYWGDGQFQELIEVAQGRQSTDNLYKLFGYFRNREEGNDQDQLAYIDIQVLNMAPKYINRAVAKMQKYSYDISVDAVDPVSIDEKAAYGASIQAFYRTQEWLRSIGIDVKEMFPELDVDMLPKYIDELMFDATVNPKIKKEIWAEIALQLLHYINEFQQKMREVDWDIVVCGTGHMHFFDDENGVPRCERINPAHYFGSYVDNENYNDQEYAGFFDWITSNQLRKEMLGAGHSEQEIQAICDRWKYDMPPQTMGNYDRFDGLTYIPVMRFYFKSEDNRSFVAGKNPKYGFDQIFEKDFNYQPEENVQQYFERGERRIIRNSYTSIYGGTWVCDTDVVYGYGRKKYPRLRLVNATLPIKTFAPNMKNGRTISFCAQMIEPLFMINVAHNKIKEILAKGWMGVREIDFTQLENVAVGKGGQQWTAREVYEYFLQTNTLIKRSQVNRYEQNPNGSAVQDTQSGLMLADYFTTFTTYINILEQMTSTAVVDSISMPDRLSATAAKQSAQTSDIDMEWLYNAHENLYYQGSHMLLLMLQEAKRDKRKIASFIPAMGKSLGGYFDVPDALAYCEYGLTMRRRPTEEQWAMFYQDVAIALQNQEISLADSVFLREIDNLKQARQIMVIRARQYKREKQEEAKFNNDLAIQSNQAAAESKLQGEVAKEKEKGMILMEVEALKGRIQQHLQDSQNRWDADLMSVENQSKERIKRQEGLDSIIKEAMRSRAERYKSDKKMGETIIKESHKAEIERKKLDQPKPKAA
jgi:hypothetical protein